MTDQLTRAWGLLREGERPGGVDQSGVATVFDPMGMPHQFADDIAYDRLCQAVERVLKREYDLSGEWHAVYGYVWRDAGRFAVTGHEDRLTSACNALEAERGGA